MAQKRPVVEEAQVDAPEEPVVEAVVTDVQVMSQMISELNNENLNLKVALTRSRFALQNLGERLVVAEKKLADLEKKSTIKK